MMRSAVVVGAAVIVAMVLAGCGARSAGGTSAPAPTGNGAGAVAGMCAQDRPDCVDTQVTSDEPVAIDKTGLKQSRRDAKYYLGRSKAELGEGVRIGRIDSEQFMLTEDYRVGRITVELDTVKVGGKPVVTSATVELPDGPKTFKLKK